MFNDERERLLLKQRSDTQSIQAWAKWLEDTARRHHPSLRSRVLLMIGRGLIALGSQLTERFGSADERHYGAPHDQVYNH